MLLKSKPRALHTTGLSNIYYIFTESHINFAFYISTLVAEFDFKENHSF